MLLLRIHVSPLRAIDPSGAMILTGLRLCVDCDRGLFCFAFFIMCGTVGYLGSSVFTKRIYRNIKCE
jgi:hypothetical protein